MFELIGYWAAVTFIVVFLLTWFVGLGIEALSYSSALAIPDKTDAKRLKYWFSEWGMRGGMIHYFGGKIKIHECPVGLGIFASGAMFLVFVKHVNTVAAVPLDHGTITNSLHIWACNIAPLFAYIGVGTMALAVYVYAIRYAYKAYKFKEKVEAHLTDTNKHIS